MARNATNADGGGYNGPSKEQALEKAAEYEEIRFQQMRWAGKAELVKAKRRAGKGAGVRECFFDEELTWFRDADVLQPATIEQLEF